MEHKQLKIGTHSGTFHSDDAMACMILTRYIPEYKSAQIIRTRDMKTLDTLDLVVDVDFKYDAQRHWYDHHQKEFNLTLGENYNIKLSGSGLVYKHFGQTALRNGLENLFNTKEFSQYRKNINDEEMSQLYHQMYMALFQSIDAIDNGISQYNKDLKPFYQMEHSDMHSRVARLNKSWWDESDFDDSKQLQQFYKAMDICEEEFIEELKNQFANIFISKAIVEKAWVDRFNVDPSGQIILLSKYTKFQKQIEEIEERENKEGFIKYCIFHDSTCNEYRVRCLSTKGQSFENRKGLLPDWRGIGQEELRKISGIEDIVFCHVAGFIGGTKTLQGAIKMAQISLQYKEKG